VKDKGLLFGQIYLDSNGNCLPKLINILLKMPVHIYTNV